MTGDTVVFIRDVGTSSIGLDSLTNRHVDVADRRDVNVTVHKRKETDLLSAFRRSRVSVVLAR